jgi:hypothetical protein
MHLFTRCGEPITRLSSPSLRRDLDKHEIDEIIDRFLSDERHVGERFTLARREYPKTRRCGRLRSLGDMPIIARASFQGHRVVTTSVFRVESAQKTIGRE